MPRLRPVDFKEVRKLIEPITALRLTGWRGRLEPCGQYRGPCPIHGSRSRGSRSFTVSPTMMYCHSCKWSGDAIAFWARIHGIPILQAAHELCAVAGIQVPILG